MQLAQDRKPRVERKELHRKRERLLEQAPFLLVPTSNCHGRGSLFLRWALRAQARTFMLIGSLLGSGGQGG